MNLREKKLKYSYNISLSKKLVVKNILLFFSKEKLPHLFFPNIFKSNFKTKIKKYEYIKICTEKAEYQKKLILGIYNLF